MSGRGRSPWARTSRQRRSGRFCALPRYSARARASAPKPRACAFLQAAARGAHAPAHGTRVSTGACSHRGGAARACNGARRAARGDHRRAARRPLF
eukprot:scaffold23195_cov113-Isochrysis_galbana.AAC.2